MNIIRISSISKSLASTISYIKSKGTQRGNFYYTPNYDLTLTDEGFVLENKKENTKTIFTDAD